MEQSIKVAERISAIKKWEKDNRISGYDILRMPGCPYKLPTARSMTQARDDYYHLMPNLISWYEKNDKHGNNSSYKETI